MAKEKLLDIVARKAHTALMTVPHLEVVANSIVSFVVDAVSEDGRANLFVVPIRSRGPFNRPGARSHALTRACQIALVLGVEIVDLTQAETA